MKSLSGFDRSAFLLCGLQLLSLPFAFAFFHWYVRQERCAKILYSLASITCQLPPMSLFSSAYPCSRYSNSFLLRRSDGIHSLLYDREDPFIDLSELRADTRSSVSCHHYRSPRFRTKPSSPGITSFCGFGAAPYLKSRDVTTSLRPSRNTG